MKKFIFLVLTFFCVTTLMAWAITTEPLYTCEGNNMLYADFTKESFKANYNSCSYFSKDKTSVTYKNCVKEIKRTSDEVMGLYNSGKCKVTGYRASLKSQNEACHFDYDKKGEEIVGSGHAKNNNISFGKTGYNETDNKCLQSLAKSLRTKYPHIKGNPLYGFEENKEAMEKGRAFNEWNSKLQSNSIQDEAPLNQTLDKTKPIQQNKKTVYKCSGYVNGSYANCSTYDPTDSPAKPVCKTLYKQGKCYRLNH